MTHTCADGQFMDRLLIKCVSCDLRCAEPEPHKQCAEYCEVWRCRAVSGQFYDALLKKCLQCSDLCGTHTPACEHICSDPLVTGRGRTVSGSPLLLYALLGVCVTVLMFSLSAAVLTLLMRRNKHTQIPDEHKQQTSEDSLVAGSDEVSQEEGSVHHHHHHPQDRPRATETCVYCFSEHTARPHTLLQQAGDQDPESVPIPQDKCGALRIICSPTQTSL